MFTGYAAIACWLLAAASSPGAHGSAAEFPAEIQRDHAEDVPLRGLIAVYQTKDSNVRRIDPTPAFGDDVGPDDPRLDRSQISFVRWTGSMLIRDAAPFKLHADLQGVLEFSIDGQTVLDAAAEERSFVSGNSIELPPGDHQVTVAFRPNAAGHLRLFWSASSFTLEPVSADVFFRDASQQSTAAAQRGYLLADAMRCTTCHTEIRDAAPLHAPSLDRVADGNNSQTLLSRLTNSHTVVTNSQMPQFGLTTEQATAIADFLLSVSKDPYDLSPLTFEEGDTGAGQLLLNSLGCVACHAVAGSAADSRSLAAPHEGPELVTLQNRRTPEWVEQWLRKPESLNADHRMPVFELSKSERRQLVAALFHGDHQPDPPSAESASVSAQSVEKGRALVSTLNCAGCHNIPGIPDHKLAARPARNSKAVSCIANAGIESGRPHFVVSEQDREDLEAWFKTAARDPSRPPGKASGALLLRRNGCLACHDRNLDRGLSSIAASLEERHPDLRGMTQGLIPPALTAVGDKLTGDYLHKAVSGGQAPRRLPWLKVRMPKFSHADADRTTLVAHLIATDRIPAAADAVRSDIFAGLDPSHLPAATESELLTGNQLMGAAGFNCVACHSAATFEPRNVALGTRGSDIMTMGSRLRTRFFLRWMKNPIRVVPGIEMPAIRRAAPGVADDSLAKQIALMWRAMRDDRFTPPTVTSRFEQLLTVRAGERPRIVRDVFTIGSGKDQISVPRAFAAGLPNGHSLLFDLDTLQFMQWTFGDFARQRTEGKSWYWDLAGVTVAEARGTPPEFSLQTSTGLLLKPVIDEARLCELLSYTQQGDTVTFRVRLHLRKADAPVPSVPDAPHADYSAWHDASAPTTPVEVEYRLQPGTTSSGREGWRVEIRFADGEQGDRLSIRNPVAFAVTSPSTSIDWDGQLVESDTLSLFAGESAFGTAGMQSQRIADQRKSIEPIINSADAVTSTPGFEGRRLPLDTSIMPTSLAALPDGRLAFTSLKGHVWVASDSDADSLPDHLTLLEEGLAAPFGILVDGEKFLVAHKPEILELTDKNADGQADSRRVIAAGWGYSDNYHDWATGLVRDGEGNLFVGLGSDYSDRKRSPDRDRWRGGIVKVDTAGSVSPVAMAFRYPMGLAFDREGTLYATDNQGVQNTFNEINVIEQGGRYGVPSTFDKEDASDHEVPAIAVPHPWARSVNSICFLPDDYPVADLRGHGLGCEYDNRFLMRFTTQRVRGQIQGCSYRFSLPDQGGGGANFIGPICSTVAADGTIYIGSIWDSGWQGGGNNGGITRLLPATGGLPNGIREVRANSEGFVVHFFRDVPSNLRTSLEAWSIRSFTRVWSGQYASPDSDERSFQPQRIESLPDGRSIQLVVPQLQPQHMYELTAQSDNAGNALWPDSAHYWMNVTP